MPPRPVTAYEEARRAKEQRKKLMNRHYAKASQEKKQKLSNNLAAEADIVRREIAERKELVTLLMAQLPQHRRVEQENAAPRTEKALVDTFWSACSVLRRMEAGIGERVDIPEMPEYLLELWRLPETTELQPAWRQDFFWTSGAPGICAGHGNALAVTSFPTDSSVALLVPAMVILDHANMEHDSPMVCVEQLELMEMSDPALLDVPSDPWYDDPGSNSLAGTLDDVLARATGAPKHVQHQLVPADGADDVLAMLQNQFEDLPDMNRTAGMSVF